MYNKQNMPRIVVTTTTYNMADTIHRTYESLVRQRYGNFYWLIIDNGSTDNTKDVISEIIAENKIEIEYYKKEYGIRATAINKAFDVAKGDLLCLVDADDELTDDGLEIFSNAWCQIPEEKRNEYCRMTALCRDFKTGNIVGHEFPKNINKCRNQRKAGYMLKEEKHDAFNLDVVGNRRIPNLGEDVPYIGETTLWYQLMVDHKVYFINKPTRIYHQENDSNESHKISIKKMHGALLATIFSINFNANSGKRQMPLSRLLYLECLVSFYIVICGDDYVEMVRKICSYRDRAMIILLTPIGYVKAHMKGEWLT